MTDKIYLNPGCALSIYKPEIENSILEFLNENYAKVDMHKTCCRHEPMLEPSSIVINVCAGCDKRFGSLYENVSTISLWEVIDSLDSFKLPNYNGLRMTIHDPCPVREKLEVHKAVRNLLEKMNINIIEAENHGRKSVCCGDSFYKIIPIEKVKEQMIKRAKSMPCDEVCVYCVSCVKAIYIGGKKPRHLIDLLMGESTEIQTYDTLEWHRQLDEYIEKH